MSEALRKIRRVVITRIEATCEEDTSLFKMLRELPEEVLRTHSVASTEFPHFTQERENIAECIQELKQSFDDPEDRQIFYSKLRTLLVDLRDKVGLDRLYFLRAINMCIDALENTKSELIESNQVEALEFVLRQMRERIEEFEVNQLQEILFNAGLKPIPKLEETAFLYE